MLTATIPRNSATAAERRIPFQLFDATDLVTPEDITVTGVKVSLSFGGGSAANSTNDIVKVDGATGRYYIELTQAESDVSPCYVSGYLKPTGCAACYPEGQIAPSTTYTDTPSESDIAAAVVAAEKDALDGLLAGEDSVTLDGQAYTAVRNNSAKYIESLTKVP